MCQIFFPIDQLWNEICPQCQPIYQAIPWRQCQSCHRFKRMVERAQPWTQGQVIYSQANFVSQEAGLETWWRSLEHLTQICLDCYRQQHTECFTCDQCQLQCSCVRFATCLS